jgi:hypothetical protein
LSQVGGHLAGIEQLDPDPAVVMRSVSEHRDRLRGRALLEVLGTVVSTFYDGEDQEALGMTVRVGCV